jgi:hypothetical protein
MATIFRGEGHRHLTTLSQTLVASIALTMVIGCATKQDSSIPAASFYKEVTTNERQAVRKYKGKIVILKGKVKGFGDLPHGLGRLVRLEADQRDPESSVTCEFKSFDQHQFEDARKLEKDQIVVISGKCTGVWTNAKTGKSNIVMLEECKVEK